ncbi:MAG: TldD/PmbA family protein [Candidatus Heimdallarchaeaceae archaeon]
MDTEYIIDLLNKTVEIGEKTVPDVFIEARYDNLTLTTINMTNELVKESSTKQRTGIGIMAYINGVPGYSFTPNLTVDGVKEAAIRAVKIAQATAKLSKESIKFAERDPIKEHLEKKVKKHPADVEYGEKLEILTRGVKALKEAFEAQSTTALYGELWGEKVFVNSEGSEIYWKPLLLDVRFSAIAMTESTQAVGHEGRGVSAGLEYFDKEENSPEVLGDNAGNWCKEQTVAVSAPPGKQRALVGPRMTGVLAHESFGHLSESDFVVTGMSPLADRLGERLGSEHATIIDEGIVDAGGFWLPFDDQGTKTTKTVILDKGILVSYLHNRATATKMHSESTGNARAITYMFQPIPRMKNTYFQPGELSEEEALEIIKNGIYAIGTTGGQAELDGTFLFKCSRGYLIENGEITKPIKDAALSGQILDFIKHIIGATKSFEIMTSYFGGCGKGGQYPLPVGLGGPALLVDEVLVGGEKQ